MSAASVKKKTEIVIVGAGIVGVCIAYYLTRHPKFSSEDYHITLLEAKRPASGASGKAGGLLAMWAFPQQIVPLSFKLHQELAEEYNGAAEWGYRGLKTLCVEGDISRKNPAKKDGANLDLPDDLDWIDKDIIDGWAHLGGADSTAQVHPYKFTLFILKKAMETGAVDLVTGKVSEILRSADGEAVGVRYTKDSSAHKHKHHNSHPAAPDTRPQPLRSYPTRNSLHHPKNTTYSKSSIHDEPCEAPPLPTDAPSPGYSSESSESIISTDDDDSLLDVDLSEDSDASPEHIPDEPETFTVHGDKVVLALGPWTSKILPSCPISGLRAHSITIQPTKPVSPFALFTEMRTGRTSYVSPEIYPRRDEVYVCGEGDTLADVPETTDHVQVLRHKCDDLFKNVGEISPQLRNGKILKRQACYLPVVDVPSHSGPFIGSTNVDNLYLASGHSCWGINNAPATGLIMAELLFDGEARSASIDGLEPEYYFDASQ